MKPCHFITLPLLTLPSVMFIKCHVSGKWVGYTAVLHINIWFYCRKLKFIWCYYFQANKYLTCTWTTINCDQAYLQICCLKAVVSSMTYSPNMRPKNSQCLCQKKIQYPFNNRWINDHTVQHGCSWLLVNFVPVCTSSFIFITPKD